MDENNTIQLFEDQAVRTVWDEEQEEGAEMGADEKAVKASQSE